MRVLFAGLAMLIVVLPAGAAEDAGAASAARLVRQLGSEDFAERTAAAQALDALGGDAVPALRAALEDTDPEVRRLAAEVLQGVERRLETARLLAPQRLRLVYKDVPVAEAVEEFARRTGFAVRLRDEPALAGKRLTLDTGETTFWDAFAQLCDRAGLAEAPPPPAPPVRQVEPEGFRARRPRILKEDAALNQVIEGPVLLAAGRAAPAFQAGALRLQVVPPDPGAAPQPGLVPLTLEVRTDPRVGWHGLIRLRLDAALDEHGRPLRLPPAFFGHPYSRSLFPEGAIVIWDGEQPPRLENLRRVTLALQADGPPPRRLREVRGVVTGEVRAPDEVLARIEDLANAAGKAVPTPDGGKVQVKEVRDEGDGAWAVRVDVSDPPLDAGLGGVRVVNFGARPVPVKVLVSEREGNCPFTAVDARGRRLRLATGSCTNTPDGVAQYTLIFQAARDQGGPAELRLSGPRDALVEVPFVLRDVPLQPDAGGRD
jgi:hypothetical protein